MTQQCLKRLLELPYNIDPGYRILVGHLGEVLLGDCNIYPYAVSVGLHNDDSEDEYSAIQSGANNITYFGTISGYGRTYYLPAGTEDRRWINEGGGIFYATNVWMGEFGHAPNIAVPVSSFCFVGYRIEPLLNPS